MFRAQNNADFWPQHGLDDSQKTMAHTNRPSFFIRISTTSTTFSIKYLIFSLFSSGGKGGGSGGYCT